MYVFYYIIIAYYILGLFRYIYINYNTNNITYSIFEESTEMSE